MFKPEIDKTYAWARNIFYLQIRFTFKSQRRLDRAQAWGQKQRKRMRDERERNTAWKEKKAKENNHYFNWVFEPKPREEYSNLIVT